MVQAVKLQTRVATVVKIGRVVDSSGIAWFPVDQASVAFFGTAGKRIMLAAWSQKYTGGEGVRKAAKAELRALKGEKLVDKSSSHVLLARHAALCYALEKLGVAPALIEGLGETAASSRDEVCLPFS